jgi:hypothetical protein
LFALSKEIAMAYDITEYEEKPLITGESTPPLCLVHYFAERSAYPPGRSPKPPAGRMRGQVAERRGNLIILEFVAAPKRLVVRKKKPVSRKSRLAWVWDGLLLVLLLASLMGCLAAFRF